MIDRQSFCYLPRFALKQSRRAKERKIKLNENGLQYQTGRKGPRWGLILLIGLLLVVALFIVGVPQLLQSLNPGAPVAQACSVGNSIDCSGVTINVVVKKGVVKKITATNKCMITDVIGSQLQKESMTIARCGDKGIAVITTVKGNTALATYWFPWGTEATIPFTNTQESVLVNPEGKGKLIT